MKNQFPINFLKASLAILWIPALVCPAVDVRHKKLGKLTRTPATITSHDARISSPKSIFEAANDCNLLRLIKPGDHSTARLKTAWFNDCKFGCKANLTAMKSKHYRKLTIKNKAASDWIEKMERKCQLLLANDISEQQRTNILSIPNLTKFDQITSPDDLNRNRRKRQLGLPTRRPLPPDFLEVPVSSKISITGTTPDPLLSMTAFVKDRVLTDGEGIDIGSPLKVMMELDDSSTLIYGMKLQSLVATGGKYDQYSEVMVVDGCPKTSRIFPGMEQFTRGKVELNFRAFRFPAVTDIKLVATVRICIQRCLRTSSCSTKTSTATSQLRPRRAPSYPAKKNTSKPALPRNYRSQPVKKKPDSEMSKTVFVNIRGYDPHYVIGMMTDLKSDSTDRRHKPRIIEIISVILIGWLLRF